MAGYSLEQLVRRGWSMVQIRIAVAARNFGYPDRSPDLLLHSNDSHTLPNTHNPSLATNCRHEHEIPLADDFSPPSLCVTAVPGLTRCVLGQERGLVRGVSAFMVAS